MTTPPGIKAARHEGRGRMGTLSRWESTITPPPGKTCTKTRHVEGRCR